MNEAVIVSAVRTPIAKARGALKDFHPSVYGALVIKEALKRAGLQGEEVEDVIFGNCLAGGGNMARLTLLEAGLPLSVPGITIDRQCGSGINAVALAAQAIQAGSADILIAGGTESMTRAPYLLAPPERAFDRNPPQFVRRRLSPDLIGDPPMGITAENLVERYHISREEQDQFAYESQQKMARAMKEGRFQEQIVSVQLKGKKGETILFDTDEHPRPETTMEALGKLPPVFKEGGTVTAGNSSGVNDGACALVIMSDREADKRGLEPLARITHWAVAGVDPNIMGIGPVPATQKVLKKAGLSLDDIDLIEINEAFAAQVLACDRELHLDRSKVNVNGGAIAHGHPIAATGAMLVTKLVYEMKRRDVKRGLVTACIGGGQGIAVIVER
ncbi:acetyl-CoA acetyltransferase [Caldalkalibacillus thermarum TA2.A1]|uniref:acetyl-CoA C-acyltransferase n=1 Tax=Caldalkalibacillus thermarum (strain TA2.A1) TaxID=986075 RepID=F5L5Y1_CALTT|nr:thiolase family protein [Caldalkalibacillus thermarum]EGL83254.1 acetyl-CoA acetyltransferase [Caldalkalibacillus thermarum TA2.A1]QZT33576.1 thiolase family protein [Caldalkalibacillus thermarum TA2.A1]